MTTQKMSTVSQRNKSWRVCAVHLGLGLNVRHRADFQQARAAGRHNRIAIQVILRPRVAQLRRRPRSHTRFLRAIATPTTIVAMVEPADHGAIAVRLVVLDLGTRQQIGRFRLVAEEGKELKEQKFGEEGNSETIS